MTIQAISSVTAPQARPASSGSEPTTERQRELKRAAGELVGAVFFGPMLKAMRNSGLKGKYGHGGRGEEIFSAQLHEVLVKRIGESQNFGINEALYQHFAKQA